MLHPWLTLRRIRRQATPRSSERGAMEVYLREQGTFAAKDLKQTHWSFARPFAMAALVVVVVSISVSSYAYASDAVLPDTVLYPVRQVIEDVQVKLAVTPVQKEKIEQKLVERRVKEVQKLETLKRPVPVKLKAFVDSRPPTTTRAIQERIEKKERQQAEQRQKKVERQQEKLEQKQQAIKAKREAADKRKAEQKAKKEAVHERTRKQQERERSPERAR